MPRDVCVGAQHSCAMDERGRVACWGDNSFGQAGTIDAPTLPTPRWTSLPEAVELACGARETCVRTPAGEVHCLGGGGDIERVGLPSPARALLLGEESGCASLPDDHVQCWSPPSRGGGGDERTVGLRPRRPGEPAPLQVEHRCEVGDGAIRCAGAASHGQLGAGHPSWHPPRPVPALEDVRSIAISGAQACALVEGSRATCWGVSSGRDAAVGPTRVSLGAPVRDLASWADHGLCLHTSSGWRCGARWQPVSDPGPDDEPSDLTYVAPDGRCGVERSGRLACRAVSRAGARERLGRWRVIGEATDYVDCTARFRIHELAADAVCARDHDGGVTCYSLALDGQTAALPFDGAPSVAPAAQLAAASDARTSLACALDAAGAVRCWGGAAYGQRGMRANPDPLEPTPVEGLPVAIELAVAASFACAITDTHELWCWGSNREGGAPDGSPRSYPDGVDVRWPPPKSLVSP